MRLRSGKITTEPIITPRKVQVQVNTPKITRNLLDDLPIDYKQNHIITANKKLVADIDTIYNSANYYLHKSILIDTIKTLLDITHNTIGVKAKASMVVILFSILNTNIGRQLTKNNYQFSLLTREKLLEMLKDNRVDQIKKMVLLNIYNQMIDSSVFRNVKKITKLSQL